MKRLLILLLTLLVSTASLAEELPFALRHGDRDVPRIAVTMDDCWRTGNVSKLLDLCEGYGVPVTFFVIGQALKTEDASLWQRAVDLGCEIGNHTFAHKRLIDQFPAAALFALNRTQQQLDEVLGYHYPMQVMRPPEGKLSERGGTSCDEWIRTTLIEAGFTHAVLWDVSQTDPVKARGQVQNGSILLYHAYQKDVQCLETLIPQLIADGYELVTVSELLGLPPVVTSPDKYVVPPN